MGNRKNILSSYAVVSGLMVGSALAIICVASCAQQQAAPLAPTAATGAKTDASSISGTIPGELTEASGVAPLLGLPDDQVLLVGDKDLIVTRVDKATDCFNSGNFAGHIRSLEDDLKDSLKVNDMEDVAWDEKTRTAFVLVSGSKNSDNERKPKREKFAQLTYDEKAGKFTGKEVPAFKDEIVKAFPELKPSMDSDSKVGGDNGTFNMEGTAFVSGKLLFGFRSPTHESDAIVVTLDNPHEIFDKGAKPQFEKTAQYLDLKGQGIRGLYYDEERKGCWLLSGDSANSDAVAREGWKLWFWDMKSAPIEKSVPRGELKNAEGVCRMTFKGKPGLLFIEDAGKDKDDKPLLCHYLLTALPQ